MSAVASRVVRAPEVIVLAVLSAVTHAWRLFTPNAVVFDEIHYLRHAGHYLEGTFYFDVHPPLGKLLYALEAWLFRVPTATLVAGNAAPGLRVLPALCGAVVVPLVYIILRQLGALRRVALFAGLCVLVDNALLVDSRLIFLEPLLICFGLVAIALFLGARRRQGRSRMVFLVSAAAFAGLALSVKWTGASALGVIGVTWATEAYRRRAESRRVLVEASVLAIVPLVVYCSVFALHFQRLRRTGPDATLMSQAFRETLIGDQAYRSDAHMSFVAKLADLHRAMSVGNATLAGVTHSAASPWYTWPVMKHPIGLWQSDDRPRRNLVLLGNPVIWWGGLIALAVLATVVARGRLGDERRFGAVFLAGGFLFNYLPFIAITRVMYLYHYLFALVWLVMLGAFVLGFTVEPAASPDVLGFPDRRSRIVYCAFGVLVLIGFIYFSPLTYGWPLSDAAYDARFRVLHPVQ